jgi:hypothetical protein
MAGPLPKEPLASIGAINIRPAELEDVDTVLEEKRT